MASVDRAMKRHIIFWVGALLLGVVLALFAAAPPDIRRNTFTTNAAPLFKIDDALPLLSIGVAATPTTGRLALYGNGPSAALIFGTGSADSGTAAARMWSSNGDLFLAFGAGGGQTLYFTHNDDNGATKEASLTDGGIAGFKTLVATNAFKLISGAGAGLIMTSDANGVGSWSSNLANGSITISNFNVTNVTVYSNLVVNNSIKINGKSVSAISVNGTNTAPSANLTNTATVTWAWDGTSNLMATAVGGGGGAPVQSTVVTLTTTGTNVDSAQINWANTNTVCYRITLTNDAFFGDAVCTNVPATNLFQWLQLDVVQDGTGVRLLTFTNSIFAGVNGTFPYTTNANAWDSFTLVNSRQTNGNVVVMAVNYLHR